MQRYEVLELQGHGGESLKVLREREALEVPRSQLVTCNSKDFLETMGSAKLTWDRQTVLGWPVGFRSY